MLRTLAQLICTHRQMHRKCLDFFWMPFRLADTRHEGCIALDALS